MRNGLCKVQVAPAAARFSVYRMRLFGKQKLSTFSITVSSLDPVARIRKP